MDAQAQPLTTPPPVPVSAGDVAALLRARTKDAEGREVGVFNESTRPTVGQVDQLIALAGQMLDTRVGVVDTAAPCYVGYLASQRLLAAMWVELSYFPEQVRTERSPYEELRLQYTDQMTALVACLEGSLPGAGAGLGGSDVLSLVTNPPWVRSRPYGCEDLIANWNPPIDVDD